MIIQLLADFLSFLRRPEPFVKRRMKWGHILVLHITIFFTVLMLGSALSSYFIEKHDISHLEDFFAEMPLLLSFIYTVIAAPILEELIFRAFLGGVRGWTGGFSWLKFAVYLSSTLFGYVHILNFGLPSHLWYFTPLLVLPQLVLGFLLAYVRIRNGLLHSIALHAFNNLIPMTIIIIAQVYGLELN